MAWILTSTCHHKIFRTGKEKNNFSIDDTQMCACVCVCDTTFYNTHPNTWRCQITFITSRSNNAHIGTMATRQNVTTHRRTSSGWLQNIFLPTFLPTFLIEIHMTALWCWKNSKHIPHTLTHRQLLHSLTSFEFFFYFYENINHLFFCLWSYFIWL